MTRPDNAAPEHVIGSRAGAAGARRDEAEASLRRISGQVTVLENFERRLNRQIHEAQQAGRDDYVRELLQRRISVRSQLDDMQRRQQHARDEVGRLG
jgi:phage shock protein A